MQSIPGGSGLVYSVTSHTAGASADEIIEVDTRQKRLRRMRKSVITTARLHGEDLQKGGFRFDAIMLTTTYRPGVEWAAKHISGLIGCFREWCHRQEIECRYVWVMELQARGVPHYHLILYVPKGWTIPKADKRGWWRHGSTNTIRARNAVGYIAKYASKAHTKAGLPAGARMHGAGGLSSGSRIERSWWMLPMWARETFSAEHRAIKVTGGFLSRMTGEILRSPWVVISRGTKWEYVRLSRACVPQTPPLQTGVPMRGVEPVDLANLRIQFQAAGGTGAHATGAPPAPRSSNLEEMAP